MIERAGSMLVFSFLLIDLRTMNEQKCKSSILHGVNVDKIINKCYYVELSSSGMPSVDIIGIKRRT